MWAWVEQGRIKDPYKRFLDLNKIKIIGSTSELQEVIAGFHPQESICFFGGSGRFLKVFPKMEQCPGNISCVFDNAGEKWGTFISGIPVRPPGQIAETNPGIIFVTTNAAVDVAMQLLQYKTLHHLDYTIFIVEDLNDDN
jgi:hypothetical protein